MITLLKQDSFSKALMLVGLETDTKPTEYFTFKGAVLPIRNGSTFYEADTATFHIYDGDSDAWIKQSGGGGYPEPSGTVQITQNGTGIDVKDYAEADVAVENSYTQADEGKVVDNGALVSQTSKNIGANGTVDTTKNNEVVVAVPNELLQITNDQITGTYVNRDLTVLPEGLFCGLTGITRLELPSLTTLKSVASDTISDYVPHISRCTNLKEVSLGITHFGMYGDKLTIYDNPLDTLEFPNLTTIDHDSYPNLVVSDCTQMVFSVLSGMIPNNFFDMCYRLESIVLGNTTSVVMLESASSIPQSLKVYVPQSLYNAYYSSQSWASRKDNLYALN